MGEAVNEATAIDDQAGTWGRVFMLTLAAILLNLGLVFAIIPQHPATATVFTLSLLASAVAVFGASIGPLATIRRRHVSGLLSAGVIAQLLLILRLPPGYVLDPPFPGAELPFYIGLAAIAVLTLALIIVGPFRPRLMAPAFGGAVATYLAMAGWMISVSPDPPMDVHIFQEQGAAALLRGENPYSITTYPDIYGPHSGLYAPELVDDGHLTFGFTYPPLSILLALPGHLLGGDYRYVQILAVGLAAVLVATIAPGRLAILAALLLLLSPRGFFVLEAGWTDVYVLALVALVTLLALRRSPFLPVALGMLTVIKQHLVLALPLAIAALDGEFPARRRIWLAGAAVAVALVVSVPMILWNVEDYWFSTVVIHLEQPFRSDSMSYLAWLGDGERPGLPTWTGFLLLFPTAAAVMWRLGRSTATYVTTLAVMYFVFFLFSKQAFVHYYHFVMGTLVIAAVAWTAMAEARAGRGELRRRPIAEQSVPLQVA